MLAMGEGVHRQCNQSIQSSVRMSSHTALGT